MRRLRKVGSDFFGLMRICGPLVALRWMLYVILRSPSILRNGNLQPADAAMGNGPFEVTLRPYKARFKIAGAQAISGIREMYVRDVYLRGGWLTVKPNAVVLDLGANMGNFTNMALSIQPTARVIAVEPSTALNRTFKASVDLNAGHARRVTLIRGLLGRTNKKIAAAVANDENYMDAIWINEDQLLSIANVESIDFLKCDIEGGEFALLAAGSKLLAITKALACEAHSFAGDVRKFITDIEDSGFTIGPTRYAPDGSAIFLAKRNG